MHELKELLKDKGAEMLARQVDIGVIQRVSVAELFPAGRTVGARSRRSAGSCCVIPGGLPRRAARSREADDEQRPEAHLRASGARAPAGDTGLNHVLLTGGTGFIGPFLMKSLLEQTRRRSMFSSGLPTKIRASKDCGGDGIDGALAVAGLMQMFEARVIPICGDLGQPSWA
jgi:hypothetical protein